jgi:SAM-dependent methyltransferase
MADPPVPSELDGFYAESRQHAMEAYQEHQKNLKRFHKVLGRLERFVPPGRLLDVGCSMGTSLVAAKERGWDAIGTELCVPAAEYGQQELGLDIRVTSLEDGAFLQKGLEEESFDAVLMHHTFEHLRHPDQVADLVYRLLRPGGVFYTAQPNHASLKARMFGECWSYGVTPEHLNLFSPRSLKILLSRRGFKVLDYQTWASRRDPRLIYDLMRRLGREDRLKRWCGIEGEAFDDKAQEAYVAFLTKKRIPFFVSNYLWPAWLVGTLRMGQDLHMVARKVGGEI